MSEVRLPILSTVSRGPLYIIARSPGSWDWPTWLNKPWKMTIFQSQILRCCFWTLYIFNVLLLLLTTLKIKKMTENSSFNSTRKKIFYRVLLCGCFHIKSLFLEHCELSLYTSVLSTNRFWCCNLATDNQWNMHW